MNLLQIYRSYKLQRSEIEESVAAGTMSEKTRAILSFHSLPNCGLMVGGQFREGALMKVKKISK